MVISTCQTLSLRSTAAGVLTSTACIVVFMMNAGVPHIVSGLTVSALLCAHDHSHSNIYKSVSDVRLPMELSRALDGAWGADSSLQAVQWAVTWHSVWTPLTFFYGLG